MATQRAAHAGMTRRGWHLPALALVGTLAAATAPAAEGTAGIDRIGPSDHFHGLAVVSERELGELRGGFSLAGLEIDFGANMRTFIDGVLALETVVTLTKSGPVSRQITPPGVTARNISVASFDTSSTSAAAIADAVAQHTDPSSLAGANDAVADASKGLTTATAAPSRDTSSASAPATPEVVVPHIDLSGLAGADGVVVNDAKGFTAALHQVSRERILGVLVNTANGRRVRQRVDVTITVKNFRQRQRAVRDTLLSDHLGRALNR